MISSSVRKSLGCILLGCMVFLYGCGSSGYGEGHGRYGGRSTE